MVVEVAFSISYGQLVATELYSLRKKTRKGKKREKPTFYSLKKKEKGKVKEKKKLYSLRKTEKIKSERERKRKSQHFTRSRIRQPHPCGGIPLSFSVAGTGPASLRH